jgi:putative membrane protein (TIGR04086 family)
MPKIVRSILALLVGAFVGGAANMAIINVNSMLFPLPVGTDSNDIAALRAAVTQAPPTALLLPIVAHAGGTLVGAWVAAKLAGRAALVHGLIIGFFFLAGGIAAAFILQPPVWFTIIDLILYLPAGWLGGRLAGGSRVSV